MTWRACARWTPVGRVTERLRSRIDVIDGRGACALPDGVRRLVASVLDGFPDHVAHA